MNITKKVKWGLFGCGFLVANGLAIPSLSSNFLSSSLSVDDFFIGGKISNLISFSDKNELAKKTRLDFQKPAQQESNLDISDISLFPKSKLKLDTFKEPIHLTVVLSSSEGERSISSSIAEIYAAIILEKKAKNIEKSLEEKYSNLLEKMLDKSKDNQNKHLNNFQVAKEQLQNRSRSRRSAPLTPTLNQDQRIALEKMYKLYHGLKDASKNLASRFKREVSDLDIPTFLERAEVASTKEIGLSLGRIGWSTKNIRTPQPKKQRHLNRGNIWEEWNKNPFRTFYNDDESEFYSDIEKSQLFKEKAYEMKKYWEKIGQQAARGDWGSRIARLSSRRVWEKKKEINSSIAASDSHIVEKVASYLLKSMGQI